jgi:hypothetical protein
MKLISHRGNITGPGSENDPRSVDLAISKGYDVEVDLRFDGNDLFLGHDTPDFRVDFDWIYSRKEKLWIHCKDLQSSIVLSKIQTPDQKLRYFCHSDDPFVLVSTGHIWMHYNVLDFLNQFLDNTCIVPLINKEHIIKYYNPKVFGVCSDYIEMVRDL